MNQDKALYRWVKESKKPPIDTSDKWSEEHGESIRVVLKTSDEDILRFGKYYHKSGDWTIEGRLGFNQNVITHWLEKVEADQQEESQLAIIANNLYNIHGSNGHGVFDTNKCDEIASFILKDLLESYTLIPKQ